MNEEQLQQIRERAEQVPGSSLATTQKDISRAFFDRTALLEEVERLRAENAASRKIVQAVAKGPTILGITTMYLCNFCDVYIGGIFGRTDHRADCPINKARALLAKSDSTREDGATMPIGGSSL